MKKFEFTIRGNKYDVKVKSLEDNIAKVEVNGSSYEVTLHQEIKTTKTPKLVRSQPIPTKEKSLAPATGLSKVVAPLPGIIIKILIKEGDTAKLGDTLFILEAMKMENNILAEKAGVIHALKVKEGDAVMQGDQILEIE
jgi:glutaconyl-CoA/methylmalonyl-CoA decarboxylase subunit gamma